MGKTPVFPLYGRVRGNKARKNKSHNSFNLKPHSQTASVKSYQIPKSNSCKSALSSRKHLDVLAACSDWYERKLAHKIKYIGLYCPLYQQETVTAHYFYKTRSLNYQEKTHHPFLLISDSARRVTSEGVDLKRPYLEQHKW